MIAPLLSIVLQPLLLMSAAARSPVSLLGNWITPDSSVVRVYSCGPGVCAKVIRFLGDVRVDALNPVQGLRDRPLCGLEIGAGWVPTGPANAGGGRIYDPHSGKTYRSTLAAQGDALEVRGYVGPFSRAEIWHRATHAVLPCRR